MHLSAAGRRFAVVLDPSQAADFDRVTRVATRAVNAPIAQFNVITATEQVSVSSIGPRGWEGRRAIPVDESFCRLVALSGNALVVTDARKDPRVCDNRATTEVGVVAYLGVPVVLHDGTTIGSLCVVDVVPRDWTADQQATLEDLVASLVGRIELAIESEGHARAEALLHAAHAELELRVAERTEALRLSEAALARSEAYFRSLIEQAPDLILLADGNGRVRYQSPSVTPVLGYAPAELVGTQLFARVHPDDTPALQEAFARVVAATNVGEPVRARVRHADGSWRVLEALGTKRIDHASAVSVIINARDVTDRVRAEDALRASEGRFRAIFDQAAVGIAVLDVSGRWLQANPRLSAIVGYTDDELRARRFHDITHPDDLAGDVAQVEGLLRGDRECYELLKRYIHRDGRIVWVLLTVVLVRAAVEADDYFVAVIEDVTERERTRGELAQSRLEVLDRLAAAAEFRDDDTGRHTQRVGLLAAQLAARLGLSDDDVELIRRAAPLHDVGKIGVPDRILLKPGKLTSEEFDEMKAHTQMGARILSGGESPLIQMAERIARSHHERWDGTGYPDALAGDAIPLEARIVAVVDVLDALSHPRPYRPAWPMPVVIEQLQAGRGTHFDPVVVDALLAMAAHELRDDRLADGVAA